MANYQRNQQSPKQDFKPELKERDPRERNNPGAYQMNTAIPAQMVLMGKQGQEIKSKPKVQVPIIPESSEKTRPAGLKTVSPLQAANEIDSGKPSRHEQAIIKPANQDHAGIYPSPSGPPPRHAYPNSNNQFRKSPGPPLPPRDGKPKSVFPYSENQAQQNSPRQNIPHSSASPNRDCQETPSNPGPPVPPRKGNPHSAYPDSAQQTSNIVPSRQANKPLSNAQRKPSSPPQLAHQNLPPENIVKDVQSGVDIQTIKNTNGMKNLRELANKFDPPAPLEKCQNIAEIRERIKCTYRKRAGLVKGPNQCTAEMAQLKSKDKMQRDKLVTLLDTLAALMGHMIVQDSGLNNYLRNDDKTSEFQKKLSVLKASLMNDYSPIVVTGQVSSGKSSFLNLLLGESVLPVQLLSCTATVCELIYSETKHAQVVQNNGRIVDVPFEDVERYIYKKSERDELFDHKSVRIYMPSVFLKGGNILVDTPGIGENETMGNVVLQYVNDNDIFSIIIVLKCNDSGGVLLRFKRLLRELSNIKDHHGNLKFSPESLLIVANFWDQVPKKKKVPTATLR